MLSILKDILRNPILAGIVYAICYFVGFSVIPLVTFSIVNTFGLAIQRVEPLTLVLFGVIIAVLIFFQKVLRVSHMRISGATGIARYFFSLIWVYITANMLSSIWIYGSIWQALQGAITWVTVDYSFIIWLALIVFLIRFVRYGYQIIFASDLKGEKGVETLEEEVKEEIED